MCEITHHRILALQRSTIANFFSEKKKNADKCSVVDAIANRGSYELQSNYCKLD